MELNLKREKKKAPSPDDLAKRLANLSNGRDEMNLCELPFATLSERSNGRNVLRFEVEDFDSEIGQTVSRTLTVTGDPIHGLPTEKDEEIYLGLLKYSSDYNRFADPEIHLQRSSLFELMGWPKSDWAYARLTKGMHRLVGVRLSYQNLWRDNSNKQWRDQGAFAILDSFKFRDSRRVGMSGSFTEQHSVFRWGSVLFQSFDSGYLKRIDYGLVRELSPTARRLYRYLDKHFHPPRKTTITIDVAKLAYQHIGVSPSTELDKVRKRYLGPASEELEQVGYLKPSTGDRFEKLRRGVWHATFHLSGHLRRSSSLRNGSPDLQKCEQTKKQVLALEKRGISTATALSLAATYSRKQMQQAIAAMDEQLRSGVTIRAADKWIQAALKNGFRQSEASGRSAARPERRVFRASATS